MPALGCTPARLHLAARLHVCTRLHVGSLCTRHAPPLPRYSNVSPRSGLNGLREGRFAVDAYPETANAATYISRWSGSCSPDACDCATRSVCVCAGIWSAPNGARAWATTRGRPRTYVVEKAGVLELFADALQHAERLVQRHGHRDLIRVPCHEPCHEPRMPQSAVCMPLPGTALRGGVPWTGPCRRSDARGQRG